MEQKKEIEIASPTGFCFGVKRAIESLEQRIEECSGLPDGGRVYSIGMPIHNPHEVERLSKKGLKVVDRIEVIPHGSHAFVRAHGAPPLSKEGWSRVAELTTSPTPRVLRENAQDKAAFLSKEGIPCSSSETRTPGDPAIVGCAGVT